MLRYFHLFSLGISVLLSFIVFLVWVWIVLLGLRQLCGSCCQVEIFVP